MRLTLAALGLLWLAAPNTPEVQAKQTAADFCLALATADRQAAFLLADLAGNDGGAEVRSMVLETMLLDSRRLAELDRWKHCGMKEGLKQECQRFRDEGIFDGGAVGISGSTESIALKRRGGAWRVVVEPADEPTERLSDGGVASVRPPANWKQLREMEWDRVFSQLRDAGVRDCSQVLCAVANQGLADVPCGP